MSRGTGIDAHAIIGKDRPSAALKQFIAFFKELKDKGQLVESEKELDGKPLCLSSVRADIYVEPPSAVLDLKTHKHRGRSVLTYQLQITAYAMLIEAEQRTPVDIGGVLEIVPEDDYRLRIFPFFHIPCPAQRSFAADCSKNKSVPRYSTKRPRAFTSRLLC